MGISPWTVSCLAISPMAQNAHDPTTNSKYCYYAWHKTYDMNIGVWFMIKVRANPPLEINPWWCKDCQGKAFVIHSLILFENLASRTNKVFLLGVISQMLRCKISPSDHRLFQKKKMQTIVGVVKKHFRVGFNH